MDLSNLPKAELHCHLDGIIDPAMLRAFEAHGRPLAVRADRLQGYLPVSGFDDFIRWFEAGQPLDGDLDAYQRILAAHVERWLAQQVVYAEIMVAAGDLLGPMDDVLARFRTFRDSLRRLAAGRLQLEYLVAFHRARAPRVVADGGELILKLHAAGLVAGVAVAGWPEAPVRPELWPILRRFKAAGLGLEIHAGEWAGPESVWQALELGADRLGHAVRLFDDPRLVDHVQRERIHLEFCPTSNLKTGSLARLEDHPLRQALDLGLNFSLNTDDPGPCECTLTGEYQLAHDLFGFSLADLEQVTRNALRARFVSASLT